jgi:hypothetical protein
LIQESETNHHEEESKVIYEYDDPPAEAPQFFPFYLEKKF